MRLQILHVPDCPNMTILTERLDALIVGRGDVVVEHQMIRDESEAAASGMTGSPTLLVDGADPFALAGQSPSLSCRLYIDEAGAVTRAPSVAQLQTALADGVNR